MLSVSISLSKEIQGAKFILPVAPSLEWEAIEDQIRGNPVPIKLVPADAIGALTSADVAIVASGTATLEAALTNTPMVIVYRMAWLTFLMARLLVRVKFVGLVNIILGRGVVRELLQGMATRKNISNETVRLLKDGNYRKHMKEQLLEISNLLGGSGASTRAADEILGIFGTYELK